MTHKRQPQNNPDWTDARDAMLTMGFRAGDTPDDLAVVLACTPGSVRCRLNKLGLTVIACAPPDGTRPQQDDNTKMRRGDLAFQRAMLKAIRSGAEKACVGVVPERGRVHWVRPLHGDPINPYGSPGALAAELGAR